MFLVSFECPIRALEITIRSHPLHGFFTLFWIGYSLSQQAPNMWILIKYLRSNFEIYNFEHKYTFRIRASFTIPINTNMA